MGAFHNLAYLTYLGKYIIFHMKDESSLVESQQVQKLQKKVNACIRTILIYTYMYIYLSILAWMQTWTYQIEEDTYFLRFVLETSIIFFLGKYFLILLSKQSIFIIRVSVTKISMLEFSYKYQTLHEDYLILYYQESLNSKIII